MDLTRFRRSSSGKLERSLEGYWAFVPNPLPLPVEFKPELVLALSDADRALGELAGIGRTLTNPHLLIRPFMHREAVLSSRIEGTQASLGQVFNFEAAQLPTRDPDDVREVYNYVQALEYGLERLATLPLSLRFIRELHERLMQGVRGQNRTPGEFRQRQNWIGPAGCTIQDSTYVPPPVNEMHAGLDAFERFLHSSHTLPPLVRIGQLHYQFEAIHPFLDGNGRIGRLLIALLLCQDGLLPQPLLYLSAYFEQHRQAYYDHLLAVSAEGQVAEWLVFFLLGVQAQSRDAVQRVQRLQDLHAGYRAKLQTAKASSLALKLLDEIFATPSITIPNAQARLGVTYPSAQNAIGRLVEAGILSEVTGRARNRLFVATEILRALEEPLPGD